MKPPKRLTHNQLIKQCDALFFKLLKQKRGNKCEICNVSGDRRRLGTFHILSKDKYRNIRYSEDNCLVACWLPCHYFYHHDFYQARKIVERIKELRGKDYEERLMTLNRISPPLKTFELEKHKFAMEHLLKYGETK